MLCEADGHPDSAADLRTRAEDPAPGAHVQVCVAPPRRCFPINRKILRTRATSPVHAGTPLQWPMCCVFECT